MTEMTIREALLSEQKKRKAHGNHCALPLYWLYASIDSTNSAALMLAKEGYPSESFVIAEEQHGGRGRRGRSWESTEGKSLMLSQFFRPDMPLSAVPQITLLAALAVKRAIAELGGKEVLIKWPNDILFGEKKVCGILSEMNLKRGRAESVIVGTGVNTARTEFSAEVKKTATSLEEEGIFVSREDLAAYLVFELAELVRNWQACGSLAFVREEYEAALAWKNEEVRLLDASGQEERGILRGINENGELLFEDASGIRQIAAGELSLRKSE